MALAPEGFGRYGETLLVGQFGSGKIIAFDPESGRYRGTLRNERHRPLPIEGLWAIAFGNGGNAGPQDILHFAAGIEDERHGLFGQITPLPKRGDSVNDPDESEEETDTSDMDFDATDPSSSTPDATETPSDPSVTPSDSTPTPSDPAVTPSDPTLTPSDPSVTPSTDPAQPPIP